VWAHCSVQEQAPHSLTAAILWLGGPGCQACWSLLEPVSPPPFSHKVYPPHPPPPATHHLLPRACPAGAINFGKINLDQFASGLVGTRTPYGVAPNAFDSRFIPGGSSSGSAAAVGGGLLSFALGTDTAGSGRVPAGYNGCVGLKGTVGKISTVGERNRHC